MGGTRLIRQYRHINIGLNPKDEAFIFKIYVTFFESAGGEISINQDFQISKSQSVFEIWVKFFASELNS